MSGRFTYQSGVRIDTQMPLLFYQKLCHLPETISKENLSRRQKGSSNYLKKPHGKERAVNKINMTAF